MHAYAGKLQLKLFHWKPLEKLCIKAAATAIEVMRDCLLKIIYSGKGEELFDYAGKEDDDEGRQACKRRRADGKR